MQIFTKVIIYGGHIMKDTNALNQAEKNYVKGKNPFFEKIGNFFFGLFVTFLFTLPVWCILMIVVYFVNRV